MTLATRPPFIGAGWEGVRRRATMQRCTYGSDPG